MAFYGVAILGARVASNFVSTTILFVSGGKGRESGENMACKGGFVAGPRVVWWGGPGLFLSG
jgi:hypothetical protein